MIMQIDLGRRYVHVLDDLAFKTLLETLDTITDFVEYLEREEHFITLGNLVSDAGKKICLPTTIYYLSSLCPVVLEEPYQNLVALKAI